MPGLRLKTCNSGFTFRKNPSLKTAILSSAEQGSAACRETWQTGSIRSTTPTSKRKKVLRRSSTRENKQQPSLGITAIVSVRFDACTKDHNFVLLSLTPKLCLFCAAAAACVPLAIVVQWVWEPNSYFKPALSTPVTPSPPPQKKKNATARSLKPINLLNKT